MCTLTFWVATLRAHVYTEYRIIHWCMKLLKCIGYLTCTLWLTMVIHFNGCKELIFKYTAYILVTVTVTVTMTHCLGSIGLHKTIENMVILWTCPLSCLIFGHELMATIIFCKANVYWKFTTTLCMTLWLSYQVGLCFFSYS